jgi:hypothetical protein
MYTIAVLNLGLASWQKVSKNLTIQMHFHGTLCLSDNYDKISIKMILEEMLIPEDCPEIKLGGLYIHILFQNMGLIWFLTLISLLCVTVMFLLLVPCYINSNLLQQDSNYVTPILTQTQMVRALVESPSLYAALFLFSVDFR